MVCDKTAEDPVLAVSQVEKETPCFQQKGRADILQDENSHRHEMVLTTKPPTFLLESGGIFEK